MKETDCTIIYCYKCGKPVKVYIIGLNYTYEGQFYCKKCFVKRKN